MFECVFVDWSPYQSSHFKDDCDDENFPISHVKQKNWDKYWPTQKHKPHKPYKQHIRKTKKKYSITTHRASDAWIHTHTYTHNILTQIRIKRVRATCPFLCVLLLCVLVFCFFVSGLLCFVCCFVCWFVCCFVCCFVLFLCVFVVSAYVMLPGGHGIHCTLFSSGACPFWQERHVVWPKAGWTWPNQTKPNHTTAKHSTQHHTTPYQATRT